MKKNNQFFNQITNDIYILRLMYIISYPLAKLFIYLKVSANTVTTLSNIFILLSVYFLFNDNLIIFIFLWIFASFLDFCDGLVARITGRSSELGGFYDQFSDQIKFFVFTLSLIIYYDVFYLTILAVSVISVYYLYHILSFKLSFLKAQLINNTKSSSKFKKDSFFKQLYYVFFLIHGHTMVFLPFLFINIDFAYFGIVVLLMASLKHMLFSLKDILKVLDIKSCSL